MCVYVYTYVIRFVVKIVVIFIIFGNSDELVKLLLFPRSGRRHSVLRCPCLVRRGDPVPSPADMLNFSLCFGIHNMPVPPEFDVYLTLSLYFLFCLYLYLLFVSLSLSGFMFLLGEYI